MTKQYRIPKCFLIDHDSRDLLKDASLDDVIVRETKKHYIVAMTDAQVNELMSDADYYKDLQSELGWDMMHLVISARATYNALLKQGIAPIKQSNYTN
jgi:hypothetical protein